MTGQTIRILMVGYTEEECELNALILQRAGYHVTWQTVHQRAQFTDAIHHDYDLILSAIRANDFNVFDAMELLKAHALHTPLIVLTDAFDEGVKRRCIEHGMSDVLNKHYLARLPMAVGHALREHHLHHEKARAESAMLASEGRFRAIFDHSPDVLLLVDATTQAIINANHAVEKTLGYKMGEVVGRNLLDFVGDASDDASLSSESLHQQLAYALNHQGSLHNFPMQHVQEGICWMDIRISSLPFESEQILLIVLRDVTQRTLAEHQLREAHRLRITVEKEREVSDLKTNFITLASHEFRTPLTVIQASNDILRTYADKLTPEDKYKHHQRIQRQVHHMRDLMDDVVTVGRLQSGALKKRIAPFDLAHLAKKIFQDAINDHPDHRFLCYHPAELPVTLDEWLVERILRNIVSNAVKYSPPQTSVTCRIEADETHVHLQISDEGIGISPEDLERIFDPFYRGVNVDDVGGTGLGLSITREAIDLHNGTIRIQSQPGQGTRVFITLPSHINPSSASAPTAHTDDEISHEERETH